MNFKLFSLSLIGAIVLIQSGMVAMYSATPAAFRSARGYRFQAPVTSTSSLKNEGGWSSGLEYMMNPQANPFNPQAQIPTATLQPEVLQSIANQPLTANQLSIVNQPSSLTPWVSMNSLKPYQNYNRMLLISAQRFVQKFFADLNNLDSMYLAGILEFEEYHLNRRALLYRKLQLLRDLSSQLGAEDFEKISTIKNLQDFLNASLDSEDIIFEGFPEEKRTENRRRFEKMLKDLQLKQEAEQLDEELGRGIPVENPYEQVKQDIKNQFTRGAKIGAVGAGTLYGLKKYQKVNN